MKKILIVDDDELIVASIADFLKGKGYTISTSTDAISACWIYSKFLPDLVICDINMPGMDGLEVLNRIRNVNPNQKFIMVTGAFLDQTGFKILKEHKVPQIIKPPDFENELFSAVENVFRRDT